ncbi:MAG: hypothetical protein QNJ97_20610 [Myxococcota bacterium]|nr:hypothetical protein [Myxococcota bacterium]
MAAKSTPPSLFLSLLLTGLGSASLGITVFLITAIFDSPEAVGEGGDLAEETTAAIEQTPDHSGDTAADTVAAAVDSSSSTAATAASSTDTAQDSGASPGAVASEPPKISQNLRDLSESGPWIIILNATNYAVAAEGWKAIKEIREIILLDPGIRVKIVGVANIRKSTKRAYHAARIIREKVTQKDRRLARRIKIEGTLSPRVHGTMVRVTLERGPQ